MTNSIEEQIKIEKEQEGKHLTKYIQELTKAISSGRFEETKEGMLLIKLGFEPFRDKIREYLGTTLRGQASKDKNYLQLLSDDENEIAFITIRTIVSILGSESSVGSGATKISSKIVQNLKKLHLFSRLKRDNPKLHSYLGSEYRRASARRKEQLIEKHIGDMYNEDIDIVKFSEQIRVGTLLLDLLVKSGANIIDINTVYQTNRKRKLMVTMTKEAYQILVQVSSRDKIISGATMVPLIVPPVDWVDIDIGGYYTHKVSFVKTHDATLRNFLRGKDLEEPMRIVNKLQKTAWRVNKRVYDVISTVFYDNLVDPTSSPVLPRGFGDIPLSKRYEAIELADKMPQVDFDTKEGKKTWSLWNKEKEKIQVDLDAENSRRLSMLLTLDITKRMKDYEKIWFVYTLDYRGRVYAHNEFLNPQTSSHVKAMLELGDGRHLTEEGLYWLKIHIANTYGKDKELLDDRVQWFEENVEQICSVSMDWRNTLSIWTGADSPYEFLAGCYAYTDYLEGKEVYLPIQLDATCSGIQMYSGLLKDRVGARLVNVIGDKREDIYQEVANEVNKRLTDGEFPKYVGFMDSEGKDKLVSTKVEIDSIKGNITRSMVKRNVMTIPYSVSRRGMSTQNWDVMHDMKLKGKNFWKGDEWVVNKAISETTFNCAYDMLESAKLGQNYLKDVARILDKPAVWYTPLYKFPVYQPALKKNSYRIKTPIGTLKVYMFGSKLDKQKQGNAIAPNYIHSIDSTILLYCVDNMKENIGVIHDCFLVHPNDGEKIRDTYKEGYIKVMESNPLKTFGKYLDVNNKIEVPNIGTLNLEEVRDSQYIIS